MSGVPCGGGGERRAKGQEGKREAVSYYSASKWCSTRAGRGGGREGGVGGGSLCVHATLPSCGSSSVCCCVRPMAGPWLLMNTHHHNSMVMVHNPPPPPECSQAPPLHRHPLHSKVGEKSSTSLKISRWTFNWCTQVRPPPPPPHTHKHVFPPPNHNQSQQHTLAKLS
jgi:hypothetical protein